MSAAKAPVSRSGKGCGGRDPGTHEIGIQASARSGTAAITRLARPVRRVRAAAAAPFTERTGVALRGGREVGSVSVGAPGARVGGRGLRFRRTVVPRTAGSPVV